MKKLLLLVTTLMALCFVGGANADITWNAGVHGWGYISNTQSCPSARCLAVAWDRNHNISYYGYVSTNTYSCGIDGGNPYNWGTIISYGGCADPNGDHFKVSWGCSGFLCTPNKIEIDTWIRYTCPSGGYLYSTTVRHYNVENLEDVNAGRQMIVDNGNGCFPAAPFPLSLSSP